MLKNESGFTKLSVAIILIASMAISAVFVHAAPSAGPPPTQNHQATTCSVPPKAPNSPKLNGSTVTGRLHELNDADDAWTASPYVTAEPDATSYVEGSASASLKIDDNFTTGAIAYHNVTGDTGALDLSKVNSITFWTKSNINLGDGILQLRLSEGKYGTGTTENLAIPGAVLDGSSWQKATVSLSGTTINYDAIRSIALYAISDPGTVTIWLDIIETPPTLSTSHPVKPYINELVYATVEEVALSC